MILEIYKFESMTTPCEVQFYSNDKKKADSCAKDILQESKRLELKYNYFNKESYLYKLNTRELNSIDRETKELLTSAKQYYKRTSGLFDITLATIKDIYKLDSKAKIIKEKNTLLPYVGCNHFSIKKDKLYFDNKYTKIDLGGFVKEYSVDRAVKIIKKYKIKSALVNFGGDIFALGSKPNGDKWRVGITNPKNKNKNILSIELENQALTTSASYERNIKIEDEVYSHILTKNNHSDILSATVISNTCVQSGVYSTSLMCDDTLDIKNEKYIITKDMEIVR